MNMDTRLVTWLTEEVWELFQAGPVGLYEFVYILNSDDRPARAAHLTLEEKRAVARQSLDELMARGGYELRWHKWATEYDEPATMADIGSESWQTPSDSPYLVIAET